MTDWFRSIWDNPAFDTSAIIGLSGFIIAILTFYFSFLRKKNKKELSYQILNQDILRIEKKYASNDNPDFYWSHSLHVKNMGSMGSNPCKGCKYINNCENDFSGDDFDDKHEVNCLKIKIFNSGDTEISTQDYEGPLKFSFVKGTKIFRPEIIEANPPEWMERKIDIFENEMVIPPKLMNKKDSFVIKLLLFGPFSDRFTLGRGIKCIKKIEKKDITVYSNIKGVNIKFIDHSAFGFYEFLLSLFLFAFCFLYIFYDEIYFIKYIKSDSYIANIFLPIVCFLFGVDCMYSSNIFRCISKSYRNFLEGVKEVEEKIIRIDSFF